jgi:hypothetical protein
MSFRNKVLLLVWYVDFLGDEQEKVSPGCAIPLIVDLSPVLVHDTSLLR